MSQHLFKVFHDVQGAQSRDMIFGDEDTPNVYRSQESAERFAERLRKGGDWKAYAEATGAYPRYWVEEIQPEEIDHSDVIEGGDSRFAERLMDSLRFDPFRGL